MSKTPDSGLRCNQLFYGSLFAGVGGFDLGFDAAGMKCKWQVELDEYRRKILNQRWPDAKQWDDIRTFEPTAVDVVCGGFPCQDISNAGKREGIDGERSGLWSEYKRIICTIRPRFVVIENVSALLVRGFDRVLGDLASLGYDAEWECIPASAFGAYHERERVFIVAYGQGEYGNARRLLEASEERRTQFEFRRLRSMVDATERRERNIRFEHEPRVARMVDGVPNRTHRIEGLGNAVYPAIAEYIGQRIVEAVGVSP
jgi:DNA (cytosine-5)-methyltransferase 1